MTRRESFLYFKTKYPYRNWQKAALLEIPQKNGAFQKVQDKGFSSFFSWQSEAKDIVVIAQIQKLSNGFDIYFYCPQIMNDFERLFFEKNVSIDDALLVVFDTVCANIKRAKNQNRAWRMKFWNEFEWNDVEFDYCVLIRFKSRAIAFSKTGDINKAESAKVYFLRFGDVVFEFELEKPENETDFKLYAQKCAFETIRARAAQILSVLPSV